MKVLVINTNRERSPQTLIPLGACLTATAAVSAGHEVEFLDLTFSRHPERDAGAKVREFKPDVTGVSVRNIDNCDSLSPVFYLDEIREIVRACRDAGAGTIIVGGSGVSVCPEPVLKYLEADYAVVGEGETAFPELLERGVTLTPGPSPVKRERGADPSLLGKEGQGEVHSLLAAGCPQLSDWLDIKRYIRSGASYPAQTKRGCRFSCLYCSYPAVEGNTIKLIDPGLVAEEIEKAGLLGFRLVEFVDSVFNIPEEHAVACCESISSLRRRAPLQTVDFNPLTCSDELLRTMKAAGFAAVGCTAESASDEMLVSLNKGYTSDDLCRTAEALKKLDVQRMWLFLVGGPGETEKTVRETVQFMEKHLTRRDLVYITFGIRIFPGTGLHTRSVAEGLVAPDDDLLYPAFYFSPDLTAERALSIIFNSGFPQANIMCAGDANSKLLQPLQQFACVVGMRPPYWKFASAWNRICRVFGSRTC